MKTKHLILPKKSHQNSCAFLHCYFKHFIHDINLITRPLLNYCHATKSANVPKHRLIYQLRGAKNILLLAPQQKKGDVAGVDRSSLHFFGCKAYFCRNVSVIALELRGIMLELQFTVIQLCVTVTQCNVRLRNAALWRDVRANLTV